MLAAAAPARAVVGGAAVASISDAPFQAALLDRSSADAYSSLACGAVVLGPRRIATAAHCVYDTNYSNVEQAALPGSIEILAGTKTLDSASGTRLTVTSVSFDPRYDADFDYDAAVLTLASDIPSNASAIGIATPLSAFSAGATAMVSGWGQTLDPARSRGYRPNDLQAVDVPLVNDSICSSDYADAPPPPLADATVCAGDDHRDSCFGDSGGPLVRATSAPGQPELIGLVSVGVDTCADPKHPGIYTEAAADNIRSYLEGPRGDAPRNLALPTVTGTATVGETLTCSTGDWSGNPDRQAVQWLRGAALVGTDTAYTATDGDVGAQVQCVVKKANDDGYGVSRSAPTATVAARPATAPPAAEPAPAPAPVMLKDTAAPVARILTARCVKQTCTITLRVTDAGVSAGIAKVTGSVRSTYRRDGRTRHRTRTFTARRTASTRFTVRLTKLPVGTQLFSLLATDKAGHRQLLPTRKTLKTRR